MGSKNPKLRTVVPTPNHNSSRFLPLSIPRIPPNINLNYAFPFDIISCCYGGIKKDGTKY